ncbi:MAG: CHASE2 domain-containing protein [Syntrophobacteraceae bacterium]
MVPRLAKSSSTVQRILFVLLLPALVALMDSLGFFEGPDRHFYDLFFRLRGSRSPSESILIAAVDEETLKGLGKWPIRRSHYAELLERLRPASVVALDILIDEPSEAEDDRLLAEAISRHGRVVLPVHIPSHRHNFPAAPLFKGRSVGHIHVEQGIDGVTREVFHTISMDGQVVPSFARAIFQGLHPEARPDNHAALNSLGESHRGLIIQSDPMAINFYGPSGTFQVVSILAILNGQCPRSLLDGKIVLVGLTTPPGNGETLTPFFEDRSRLSGVEVHATILNNLLDDSYIRKAEPLRTWGVVFVLSTIGLVLFPRFAPSRLLLVWSSVLILASAVLFRLFVSHDFWVSPSPIYAALTGCVICVYIQKLRLTQESLRASQQDWEESFHTIDDAVVLHDDQCQVVRANEAASRFQSDVVLKTLEKRCRQLIALSKDPPVKGLIGPNPTVGDGIPTEELFDEAADRWYEIRSVPRTDRRRQFLGGVHVVRDITDRKRHEREQQELQLMLSQAQKMEAIGTLTGGIAHDFNNILSGIMGYTEIVYRQLPEESPLRGKLDQVLKASTRARDIIQQLLTFSRKGAHEKSPLEMAPLVTEAIKLVRVMLPATIEIQQNVHSGGSIQGDPSQVHQILLNLATNALHAMRDKGGILEVDLEDVVLEEPMQMDGQMLRAGPYVKLSVRDTGHGIPDKVRARIFEPYFTTKTQGEGTGLGLATVRGIVQNYSGLITVESWPGKGTRFSIYFPRLEGPGGEAAPECPDSGITGQGHVLFVDDDPDLTDLVSDMLETLGYRVTSANTPLEAIEIFRAGPDRFKVVITDMSMPGMTGEELAEELLRIRSDIPVILCTGYGDATFRSGARTLLTKPFKLKDLAKALADLG